MNDYTDEAYYEAQKEIEDERDAFWTAQMQFEHELGAAIGSAKRLCDEIDREQRERGYTPRQEAIMLGCPF
jgi:hypothetical protein